MPGGSWVSRSGHEHSKHHLSTPVPTPWVRVTIYIRLLKASSSTSILTTLNSSRYPKHLLSSFTQLPPPSSHHHLQVPLPALCADLPHLTYRFLTPAIMCWWVHSEHYTSCGDTWPHKTPKPACPNGGCSAEIPMGQQTFAGYCNRPNCTNPPK